MNSIGSNIKKLREESGMTMEQLGRMLGKTRAAVSQYENGKIIPRMGVIEDMAHIFGVSKSEIIGERQSDMTFNADELELVKIYRNVTVAGKKAIMTNARAVLHEYKKET